MQTTPGDGSDSREENKVKQEKEASLLAQSQAEEISNRLELVTPTIFAPSHFCREYTPELADEIIGYFISGNTFAAISRMEGMPKASHIYRFMYEYPEFRKKVQAAREIRALAFEDMAIESGSKQLDKDDVPSARLNFDTFSKAAEWADPKQFGKKVEVGGGAQPIQIVVNTGWHQSEQLKQEHSVDQVVEQITNPIIQTLAEEVP